MSHGPGHVERSVAAAFGREGFNRYTTDDLARLAYPDIPQPEKRHRVAVLRAVHKVAARMGWAGKSQVIGSMVFERAGTRVWDVEEIGGREWLAAKLVEMEAAGNAGMVRAIAERLANAAQPSF